MNMSLLLLEFACGALLCSLLLIPGLALTVAAMAAVRRSQRPVRQPVGGR